MTSKPLHVRLEVMVDGHDGALCGDACRYLAHEDRGDGTRYWCTSRADGRMVRALLHRDAETFRSATCRALTASDALNAAVVEAHQRLETWLSAHPWRELGLCVAEMNDGTHFEAKLWSVRAVKGPTLERAITRALDTFEHEEAVDALRTAERKGKR